MTPKLIYFQEGKTQSLALPGLALPAFGSAIIDLTKQADGVIPEGVSEAALELQPNAPSGSIVAELFNFDGGTGGYVVGPSFTSYPAHGTASEWRIDGDFTTTAIMSNAAAEDDKLVLKLYSAAGLYSKAYAIPAGDLVSINLKQLQQDATPDDSGNTLTGTSGIMYLSGSRNNLSKLTFDLIVHSTSEADYVGYQNNPCDMVDAIDIYLLSFPINSNPYTVMQEWDWSISGADDQPATQTASSNTSIAQISQNNSGGDVVTVTPPNDGQSHSVTLYFGPGSVNATDCEACSYGPVPVTSDTITVNQCDFSLQPTNGDITASYCDALTDNSQPWQATPTYGYCKWIPTGSSCSFAGGGIQGDPAGTAEVHPDGLDNQITNSNAECTAKYLAGPPDSNNHGGSYGFAMSLKWYGGNEPTTAHSVSGLVDCPAR